MKKELSRKVKITIGVIAFVIVMAFICWIVALALLYTDIKTEVYGAEFDHVDNIMYDNAYITMKGGRWQLYRNGGSISRTFSHLEYDGSEGRFSFINNDGKGWGYINTSGEKIVEFTQEYTRLIRGGNSLVGIRVGENDFSVRNAKDRNFRENGKPLLINDFPEFYYSYGDRYVAYLDKDGKYMAVDTQSFERTELPFDPTSQFAYLNGYLTLSGENAVTYGPDLKKADFLDGYLPLSRDAQTGYVVVGGEAVLITQAQGGKRCTLSGGKSFIIPSGASVELTDGATALVRVSDMDYMYYDGNALTDMTKVGDYDVLGGSMHIFEADGGYTVIDSDCNVIKASKAEIVTLVRRKEKNRVQYTVDVKFLVADGKLYTYDADGKLTARLTDVISVMTNRENDESRIVTQSGENGTVIYDSFFDVTDRKSKMTGAEVIDPFVPVYAEWRNDKKLVTMPRGSFEIELTDFVWIVTCTDPDNYYAFVRATGQQSVTVYGKNGAVAGKYEPKEGSETVFSPSQILVYGDGKVEAVTKNNKVLNIRYRDIYFGVNNKYAVALGDGRLWVLNLNDASVSDTRYISGKIEIVDSSENTFLFKDDKGLFGIINDGKVTLSPTYKQAKLHDGFIIASVDTGSDATFFQADYSGKRISDTYYELECTEGLTIGKTRSGESEIMNARGRVILKHVTYVPITDKGFDFMESYVYDEETGRTLHGERRDNTRLLTVTAGGVKRVISITREE